MSASVVITLADPIRDRLAPSADSDAVAGGSATTHPDGSRAVLLLVALALLVIVVWRLLAAAADMILASIDLVVLCTRLVTSMVVVLLPLVGIGVILMSVLALGDPASP